MDSVLRLPYDAAVRAALSSLERNLLPDIVVRRLTRLLLAARLRLGYQPTAELQLSHLLLFKRSLLDLPIAILTEKPKSQHYELPTSFFKLVLGKHLKYSSCYFLEKSSSLDDAELAMLDLYCERAQLMDGQSVLDVGCGWGSLSLFVACKFPDSHVTGICNSITQKEFIDEQCRERQLTNVEIIVADISNFVMEDQFDRVISIEMFEHMKNYKELLKKISLWMKPDGLLFIHYFCHKTFAYHFEDDNEDDWITRYFFSGGTMASANLLLYFQDAIERSFLDFYHSLWNVPRSSSLNLDAALPSDLPRLSEEDSLALVRDVSKEEVYLTLLDLPSGKSPGPDGFNVEFYRSFWHIVGDRFFDAIQFFFHHSTLPAAWGRTYITLVPKKDKPISVSDFRPISLCNVCFKVISKLLANRLKCFIPKLIGTEQVGFVNGRSSFDNIIAVQEIAHSVENEASSLPRMILKYDIAKAYDTLEWSAILAVLARMNFHPIWIGWISACLNSCTFSILINGTPSSWFSASRGVRQGDPISSYLFILVSQVLTNLLNSGLTRNLIPSFYPDSRISFNHLMYADDLIIATQASRRVARNINLCMSLYSGITGQNISLAKSQAFFPSWINSHLANRIGLILDLKRAFFPFNYLGVLISPKRISSHSFQAMVDKIRGLIARWSSFHLSYAAKEILINSSILSIPVYTLSVYPVPEFILAEISKMVRKFFWSRNSNGKGIHNVNWSIVSSGKPEGGLGIRQLSLVRHSLMAKLIFKFLNNEDIFWVNIIKHKYGPLNFWLDKPPAKCSQFFRGLCSSAKFLIDACKLNSVNPDCTSFLRDPWLFDVPIMLKPTFLNMDLDFNHIRVNDLIIDSQWAHNCFPGIFGNCLDVSAVSLPLIDFEAPNNWVWKPSSSCHKISAAVYQFYSRTSTSDASWPGWGLIWKLPVAPRIKHFIWLCLHGRLSTTVFLHRLNLGPDSPCTFCGLHPETIEHLLRTCDRIQDVWRLIFQQDGSCLNWSGNFSSGDWITNPRISAFGRALIAACAWSIWIHRCNVLFRNDTTSFSVVACRAIAHARDSVNSPPNPLGKKLILSNFSAADGLFLFIHVISNPSIQVSSVGFLFVDAHYQIHIAGCYSWPSSDQPSSDILLALGAALHTAVVRRARIRHIFSVHNFTELLISPNPCLCWRYFDEISNSNFLLDMLHRPTFHEVPHCWMRSASSLASLGLLHRHLNLFLFGRDLPHWVMKSIHLDGFSF